MPLLRRLWGARRTSVTVAEALRHAEQRRREGRYIEAGELVARVLELDPQNLHAHLLAGYLHAARRAPTPAKAEFRWVLGHDANHPRALVGLARIALEENDARVCHDLLRRALRYYPDFPEAAALLDALHAREASAARTPPAPAAARMDRLRLPGGGRALIVGRVDGGLIASLPTTDDAKEVAEAVARVLRLAAGTLGRAGLGAPHRAIVDDDHDAVFIRTDGELVVSLALPRATDPTQGLLDVNRLWAATLHELGLADAPPTSPATPVSTPADRTRRAS
jgi:predicted regulator of Ras-like GTPase activity (Roadblock/LC7/MglB family)